MMPTEDYFSAQRIAGTKEHTAIYAKIGAAFLLFLLFSESLDILVARDKSYDWVLFPWAAIMLGLALTLRKRHFAKSIELRLVGDKLFVPEFEDFLEAVSLADVNSQGEYEFAATVRGCKLTILLHRKQSRLLQALLDFVKAESPTA